MGNSPLVFIHGRNNDLVILLKHFHICSDPFSEMATALIESIFFFTKSIIVSEYFFQRVFII